MTLHHALRTILAAIMLAATTTSAAPTAQTAPLTMDKAWLSIEGTSNIHDYTAWTDTVRVHGSPLGSGSLPRLSGTTS